MKKFLMLFLAPLLFSSSLWAQDFVCTSPSGCEARLTEGGRMTSTTFRKGDIVSKEAGWIISTRDGWKKIKTRDDGAKPAPPIPKSHPWWYPIPCGLAGCHFVAGPFGPRLGYIGPIPPQIALIGL